ncbi:MAG: glycoside hydrolase family 3 C-terminal domain-containing protein [Bacteroidetes bacterium]|nr:glycoside hydrolase family 3 C-terminal domain-containing protein [Bacteroidota bacterium]
MITVIAFAFGACSNESKPGNKTEGHTNKHQTTKTEHADLQAILDKMSLKDKVGQMTQLNLDVISVGEIYNLKEPHELDAEKLNKAIVEYGVGSILNVGGHAYSLEHWHEIITKIQDIAINQTSHKVPVLYGIDAIHGANYLLEGTLFPQQLAQAATFNPSLVEIAAAITAYETKASGIPWNFSPVLDLGRQPVWSRFFETYGEDVYLAKTMGTAAIKGYQGTDASNPEKLAACMKHFFGYSMPWTGRDRTPVYLHERQLREYFMPTFEAAVKQGALSVMINSGELNGIPVHADKAILTDLLRTEMGFDGVAVTDWEDIMKLNNIHKVAPTLKDAVAMAINAGIDMSMVPNDYRFSDLLVELVEEGQVPMSRIDESVMRILVMKKRLGLFENPVPFKTYVYDKVGSAEHDEASYQAACEAITLLKNENSTLPISKKAKVYLTGVGSADHIYLNGAWSRTWQGTDPKWDDTEKLSILEAAEEEFEFATYLNIDEETLTLQSPAKAKQADRIVVTLGEFPSTEKPGDISDLDFDERQINLVKELARTGKPVTAVLLFNRPRIISEIEPICDAIIMAYNPGDEGGRAIADILSGDVNPSGKLPFTYPRNSNALLTYDHKYTEKLDPSFGMNAFNPQYEFGYGLSYSTYAYSDIRVSTEELAGKATIDIEVDVTNTSEIDGKEAVLVFVSDSFASITPSVKRLRAFEKKAIKAGQTITYQFSLSASDLAFVATDLKWTTEEGWFTISVADKTKSFFYKK